MNRVCPVLGVGPGKAESSDPWDRLRPQIHVTIFEETTSAFAGGARRRDLLTSSQTDVK